jgi:hypothetical protein
MSVDYQAWRHTWPTAVTLRDTEVALDLLTRYYSNRADGLPFYTGSRFEETAQLNPDPNVIGPADLVAVSLLSVTVPNKAAVRLLDANVSKEISLLLRKVPSDVDIVDASESMLTGDCPANQLWRILRSARDGIGRTTASKLLAAKRPRLIPIWDSFIGEATGLDTDDNWRKFQTVLLADDRAIWNWLEHLRAQVPNLPSQVSTLRLLDVILWMLVKTDSLGKG